MGNCDCYLWQCEESNLRETGWNDFVYCPYCGSALSEATND